MADVLFGGFELKIVKGGTLNRVIAITDTPEDLSSGWTWYCVGTDALSGSNLFTLSSPSSGITVNSADATSVNLTLTATATVTGAYDWDDAYHYIEARNGANTHTFVVGKLTLLTKSEV